MFCYNKRRKLIMYCVMPLYI